MLPFKKMLKYLLPFVFSLTFIVHLSHTENVEKDKLRRRKFPQCEACKMFTESFKRGMETTEKATFEGGDTAWEEANLGRYATSEIRLVEIQEKICSDIEEGRDQCYVMLEEYGDDVEEWWLNFQSKYTDLTAYLCIEKLPYCCQDLHYGPKCLPCPGYPENVCSLKGYCAGNGTRKGNGRCVCDKGYSGKSCEACAKKYYESQKGENQIICARCPKSCDGSCTKFGCEKCAKGWSMDKGGLCMDIDECSEHKSPCEPSQYCTNTEGSFKCHGCDFSCEGCSGKGPENCKKCIQGYKMVEGTCAQEAKYKDEPFIYVTKVLIYFMTGTTACVVYKKSSFIAMLLALVFTVYMTPIEYMLSQL